MKAGIDKKVALILRRGGVGVLPTDTIYGLVGLALKKKTVERIFKLKGRRDNKPVIVLVSAIADLRRFGVSPNRRQTSFLKKNWPGPVSVILPCVGKKMYYLHRNSGGLAFRLPDNFELAKLIRLVGPLIAPSANPEGRPPAKNINEAKKYFGDDVDFYSDGGEICGQPSTLVRLYEDGSIDILRKRVKK